MQSLSSQQEHDRVFELRRLTPVVLDVSAIHKKGLELLARPPILELEATGYEAVPLLDAKLLGHFESVVGAGSNKSSGFGLAVWQCLG